MEYGAVSRSMARNQTFPPTAAWTDSTSHSGSEQFGSPQRSRTGGDPFGGRNTQHPFVSVRDQNLLAERDHIQNYTHTISTLPEVFPSFQSTAEPSRGFTTSTSQQHITVVPPNLNTYEQRRRSSQDSYYQETESPTHNSYTDFEYERSSSRASANSRTIPKYHTRRKPYNQDEFDGPTQLLPPPSPRSVAGRERSLPRLPVHLSVAEQDEVLLRLNDILSGCAFHFISKYNFPIPLDREKPQIHSPADRDWTEWAYLLKRLATKRRIPARFLFDNQIKQFVTTVENSITVRNTSSGRSSSQTSSSLAKDDRNVLQLVSAGIQVAKIMMDAVAMEQLDNLYQRTESIIAERRNQEQMLSIGPSGMKLNVQYLS